MVTFCEWRNKRTSEFGCFLRYFMPIIQLHYICSFHFFYLSTQTLLEHTTLSAFPFYRLFRNNEDQRIEVTISNVPVLCEMLNFALILTMATCWSHASSGRHWNGDRSTSHWCPARQKNLAPHKSDPCNDHVMSNGLSDAYSKCCNLAATPT